MAQHMPCSENTHIHKQSKHTWLRKAQLANSSHFRQCSTRLCIAANMDTPATLRAYYQSSDGLRNTYSLQLRLD
jgi:hypothetical protein